MSKMEKNNCDYSILQEYDTTNIATENSRANFYLDD